MLSVDFQEVKHLFGGEDMEEEKMVEEIVETEIKKPKKPKKPKKTEENSENLLDQDSVTGEKSKKPKKAKKVQEEVSEEKPEPIECSCGCDEHREEHTVQSEQEMVERDPNQNKWESISIKWYPELIKALMYREYTRKIKGLAEDTEAFLQSVIMAAVSAPKGKKRSLARKNQNKKRK